MLALLLTTVLLDGPAPVVSADQWRFPYTKQQIDANCTASAAHVAWLDANGHMLDGEIGLGPFLQKQGWKITFAVKSDWLKDAEWRAACWNLLKKVRDEKIVCTDDIWLQGLRYQLGDYDYQLGRMPDPAPYWRFRNREKGEP